MPALIAILSRAVVRIRVGGTGKCQSCKGGGGEGDVAHFAFPPLSVAETLVIKQATTLFSAVQIAAQYCKIAKGTFDANQCDRDVRAVCLFYRSGPLPHVGQVYCLMCAA
jgi:hypothetical protein